MQLEVSTRHLDTTKKWLTLALKYRRWFGNPFLPEYWQRRR